MPTQTATPIELSKIDLDDGKIDWQAEQISLAEYLKTRTSPVLFKGFPVLNGNYDDLLVKNNRIFAFDAFNNSIPLVDKDVVCGVILPQTAVLNGDENANDAVDADDEDLKNCPAISFNCIARLIFPNAATSTDEKLSQKVAKEFLSGRLSIVAFNPDKSIDLSESEKEKLKEGKPIFKLGYSPVGKQWHQAATAVLRHVEYETDFLIGQDEGTYFGVQLPKTVSSVAAAMASLVPDSIVNRKDLIRQGEWFLVPVKDSEIPELKDCIAEFDAIILPREDEESNEHTVSSCSNGRIAKDGRIFANDCDVEHDDHQSTYCKGWCTFVRNTALRSVSIEGVD